MISSGLLLCPGSHQGRAKQNFLSDFTLPAIAQVITDQGLTHFVVIFKKTTIKDDDARRKHVVQEEERKADASKKYKCKDYVVIGDPANELKKISLDEFYKNFTGVLLLNPTAEFKGGTGKHKVEGKEEAKAARNNMLKRYMDLLLPQKKAVCLRYSQFSDPDTDWHRVHRF